MLRLVQKSDTLSKSVLLVLAMTQAIVLLVVLVPVGIYVVASAETDRIDIALSSLAVAIDPRSFFTVEEKVKLGERLVAQGVIEGGVVYNTASEPLRRFGTPPHLTMAYARTNGLEKAKSPAGTAIDVVVKGADYGFSHDLIMRVPLKGVATKLKVRLAQTAGVILFISLLTSIVMAEFLRRIIIKPLVSVKKRLAQAAANPEGAKRFAMRWSRRDEVGEIARAFDRLLVAFMAAAKGRSPNGSNGQMDALDEPDGRLEAVEKEASALRSKLARSEGERKRLNGRVVELKHMLESCLTLIDAGTDPKAANEPVMPEKILDDWYDHAQKAGLVDGKLRHDLLPPVEGPKRAIEAVFRLGLLYVYASCKRSKPFLEVVAADTNGSLEFQILEVTADAARSKIQENGADPAIAMAGFRVALSKANGVFIDANGPNRAPLLKFTLPAARGGLMAKAS
ncbi:MAG: hypothetical protein AAF619_10250 [Pseudomonadota bacterium]